MSSVKSVTTLLISLINEVLSRKGSSAMSSEVAIGGVWSPNSTTESFTLPLHPQNPNHNKIAWWFTSLGDFQQVEHFNKQTIKVWDKWERGNVGSQEEYWTWTWQEAMNAPKADRFMIGNFVFPHGPPLPLVYSQAGLNIESVIWRTEEP